MTGHLLSNSAPQVLDIYCQRLVPQSVYSHDCIATSGRSGSRVRASLCNRSSSDAASGRGTSFRNLLLVVTYFVVSALNCERTSG